ncbi:MAG: bifunctional diaminohydroxyphosphoribosylaminopyrimidine deaminase/5-amino-6-(5-phosphoribosylamino)uracil reductase RibD [Pseudomonadota bacterium]
MTDGPSWGGAPPSLNDVSWLRAAAKLARRHLGQTGENPSVGCILVNQGRVVGRGVTGIGGRPHAEALALERAGPAATGATAYVTLEPCAHQGKTPPCADHLIAAGVDRCVVLECDPDPRVAGRGMSRLRAAGIDLAVMAQHSVERDPQFWDLNAGFISRITAGRPFVTLKLATTLDGKIALASGESQWITGPAARRAGHLFRAQSDGILVGSGTALADNPKLTVRLPGLEGHAPRTIVWDGQARLDPDGALAKAAAARRAVLLTTEKADGEKISHLSELGFDIQIVHHKAGRWIDPSAALVALGGLGLSRLLVEGGGRLAATLLAADLVDCLVWHRAASVIGADGIDAIGALDVMALAQMPRFHQMDAWAAGPDEVSLFRRAR